MNATLSRRPLRRFWGWGAASEQLTQEETARISMMVQMLGGQLPKTLSFPDTTQANYRILF